MVSQKRALDDSSSSQKPKKRKNQDGQAVQPQPMPQAGLSLLNAEEIDFPRGGGSSLTALEVKAIRAEGAKEAEEELFKDEKAKAAKKKGKSKAGDKSSSKKEGKSDKVRIEHLNYKRLNVGMKIMGQIIGILPLALLVSLPNQLMGHIPITNISPQYTQQLEKMDEVEDMSSADSDEEEGASSSTPDLGQLFTVGQYVRAVVTATFQGGASDPSGLHKSRDETAKLCKRVELTLSPEQVNEGVKVDDLKAGFTLTAAVRSVEDHGYILDLGIPSVDGFISFKDTQKGKKMTLGEICNVTVTKLSSNKRTCTLTASAATFNSSVLAGVSSVTSILPGALVQGLVTDTDTQGLNVQILGFFESTVDRIHLRRVGNPVKVGQKVKGRVLYQYSTEPPRFAIALSEHITELDSNRVVPEETRSIQEVYPFGQILDSVKVTKVEAERGLFLEVAPGVEGFAHISHISDDHLPSLTASGAWKFNTLHRARVTGYHMFDGLLQLSLKPSIFEQQFLQLTDFKVGEIVKGTIKSVSDSSIFVSLSNNIDGVMWPNHYADIRLKHPSRRFKPGSAIKCKVLVVDSDRKRISLTAKKTLLESELPIVASIEDAKVGTVTNAVVFRVFEKHLMVEFFNNIKAIVPAKEASELSNIKLMDTFSPGKVIRVRIQSVNLDDGRIIASIKQAGTAKEPVVDVTAVEIGDVVQGTVSEVHGEHVVLTLQPTKVRALLSIKNLANHRKLSAAQVHKSVKAGDILEDLVVVTRNPDKGIVIVANKPTTKPALPLKGTALNLDTITVGQRVGGRVIRQNRQGTMVKISANIGGILYPTDTSDNYDDLKAFPSADTLVMAAVLQVEKEKRQLILSTRESRLNPDKQHTVVDREISSLSDLQVGDSVRGFVKNIADHGLFVTIGRGIDARVQIRELFDEFVKEWKPRFKEHQLVKGRILSIDPENNKVEMTFKSGDLSREKKSSVGSVKEGQKVNGVIKRVEPYGLFIDIEGTKLHGLCHKSELSDNAEADVSEALNQFRAGDKVKAVVLSADKGRISLSLKPSLFDAEDFEDDEEEQDDVDSEGEEDEEAQDSDQDSGFHDSEDAAYPQQSDSNDDDDAMQVDLEDAPIIIQQPSSSKPQSSTSAPSLSLAGGFQWFGKNVESGDEDEGGSSSDESDAEGDGSKKKRKRRRKEIQKDLTADMHTKVPDSNADFERLLLGSPNSSFLWIQYMSFRLQISEVDKAREIAKRAVQTISFREEQERLNVWIALLNLENVYGTDESLENTFRDAARANDSKTVHLRLAAIFDQSGKFEKAEQQFQRTCKKFGKSCKVWTLFGEFYLRHGKVEESRKLLPRSLQSLEKRKHLKTISRFAQLEYKLGDAERGRTLFEGIIDSHPKRWDLWSVYIDMEGVQQNIQAARNIFDRVLALKMTSHKAKSFFKKWLDLEKRLGDEEGIKVVKSKAIEWTQKASAES